MFSLEKLLDQITSVPRRRTSYLQILQNPPPLPPSCVLRTSINHLVVKIKESYIDPSASNIVMVKFGKKGYSTPVESRVSFRFLYEWDYL